MKTHSFNRVTVNRERLISLNVLNLIIYIYDSLEQLGFW